MRQIALRPLMQQSQRPIKTFSFQDQLPRLPLPDLQQSANKYLESVRPLLSAEKFLETERSVKDFVRPGGLGVDLQMRLQQLDSQKKTSWLDDMWLELAYLRYREPILVNVNWFMVWKDHPKQYPVQYLLPQSTFSFFQIHRAARIIQFAAEYKKMIENEQVEIERTKQGPICMQQLLKLVGVTRIPEPDVDRLSVPALSDLDSVIVLIDEQIFSVKVIKDGQILPLRQIERLLLETVKLNDRIQKQPPVGILTTENRDVWADAYKKLQLLGNQASFDAINKAMLAVSLESASISLSNLDEKAKFMFCGKSGSNRWFDKSLNFIVFPDGTTGCNGEHSPCDAVVPSRMIDFIIKKQDSAELRDEETPGYSDYANLEETPWQPVHLQWKINSQVADFIEKAKKNADSLINDTALAVTHEPRLTTSLFKSALRTSPDAFIQACLQLTFYKLHGKFANTYETASTRKFKYGRTETIRPLTLEMMEFVQAFWSSGLSNSEKRKKYEKFAARHLAVAKECAEAQGFDRHFLGLQYVTKKGENHEIFKDPIFSFIRTFVLSTSNMSPAEYYNALGFGPGCVHGYGINYAVSSDKTKLSVSARIKGQETSPSKFRDYFHQTVTLLLDLLSQDSKI